MSVRSTAAIAVQEAPSVGAGLLLAVAAAIVSPFDCVLAGMIRAGLGIEAICACFNLSRADLDYNIVRLALSSPHDRPRRKGGRRPWPDDELRLAIYWRLCGIHPETIGLAFDRSAGAVRSKMHRLGVSAPDRKKLHKVDPATLSRTAPDFGFPLPPNERDPSATTRSTGEPCNALQIVPVGNVALPPIDTSAPAQIETRRDRNADVADGLDLFPLRVIPASKAEPEDLPEVAAVLEVASIDVPLEKDVQSPLSDYKENGGGAHDDPQVIGPADLIRRFQVVAPVHRPDTNEAFLLWMTLLYLGGMHYKAIAQYLGLTKDAVQAILYRMQMPRDKKGKFTWICDLECAVEKLKDWDYQLIRSNEKAGLATHEQPLFWRHHSERGARKRRCTRLKNGEFDDYDKYKNGYSVEIMTRAQLEAKRQALNTDAGVQHPSRLQSSMQGSPSIKQGDAHEQFKLRGHEAAVRPGLPGHARDQMPWSYPRNGGAARPVAHP